MAKTLTTVAVMKLKPGRDCREVSDGGCPGLRLSIQPSGHRSWIIRYKRPDGTSRKLTLGTCDTSGKELEGEPVIGGHLTLVAARRLATEQRQLIAQGRDPAAEKRADKAKARIKESSTGFVAAAREFFEQHQRDERANRTWRKQARVLGLLYHGDGVTVIPKSFADRWGDKPVDSITDDDVFRAIDEAYRKGVPGRAAREGGPLISRKREMSKVLSGFLRWLRDRRLIDGSALGGITKVEPSKSGERVLSNVELAALWRALDDEPDAFARVIRLMMLTGARRGEVMAMTWAELDDDRTVWVLPSERSKNKRAHDVPLSAQAREQISLDIEQGEFVFSTDGGETHAQGFGKLKQRLDAKLKFAAPWRFHDLRRTVVTGMIEIGIQPHVVEACVNHVSGHKGGVAGIYNRSQLAEPRRKALERWAAHVGAIVTGREAVTVVPIRAVEGLNR